MPQQPPANGARRGWEDGGHQSAGAKLRRGGTHILAKLFFAKNVRQRAKGSEADRAVTMTRKLEVKCMSVGLNSNQRTNVNGKLGESEEADDDLVTTA